MPAAGGERTAAQAPASRAAVPQPAAGPPPLPHVHYEQLTCRPRSSLSTAPCSSPPASTPPPPWPPGGRGCCPACHRAGGHQCCISSRSSGRSETVAEQAATGAAAASAAGAVHPLDVLVADTNVVEHAHLRHQQTPPPGWRLATSAWLGARGTLSTLSYRRKGTAAARAAGHAPANRPAPRACSSAGRCTPGRGGAATESG